MVEGLPFWELIFDHIKVVLRGRSDFVNGARAVAGHAHNNILSVVRPLPAAPLSMVTIGAAFIGVDGDAVIIRTYHRTGDVICANAMAVLKGTFTPANALYVGERLERRLEASLVISQAQRVCPNCHSILRYMLAYTYTPRTIHYTR